MKSLKKILGVALFILVFSSGFNFSTRHAPAQNNLQSLYIADTLLYLSDRDSGISVYSVADPARPAFHLNIPVRGNAGLAVRDSFIFTQNQGSLLVLKIFQDTLYKVVKVLAGYEGYHGTGLLDDVSYGRSGLGCGGCGTTADGSRMMASDVAMSSYNGGSSYATFAVIDSFLYYIDGGSLTTLNIAHPESPVTLSTLYLGWGVETLFPTDKYLFLGETRGMRIFDRSVPAAPFEIGAFTHARACDPVVVRDTLAFVTLRSGSVCGLTRDTLLVISVKDPAKPVALSGATVPTPYGLAVKDSLLYVAAGLNGYRLFNIARPNNLSLVANLTTIPSIDFIWNDSLLYLMGFTGVTILSTASPSTPQVLSNIP
ncbi:MAG: hypothetical protein V1913_18065 [Fibrobacterota bacterium]